MQRFENSKTWEVALNTIRGFQIGDQEYIKLNNDRIKEKCCELAYYDMNDKTKNKSELELIKLENNGEIFNSHLFIRLAKHLYLAKKTVPVFYKGLTPYKDWK